MQDKRSSSAEELQKQSYVGPMCLSQVHLPTQSCYLTGTIVFLACHGVTANVYTLTTDYFWHFRYIPCHSDRTKKVLSISLMSLCIAGVMAGSQDLLEGDLVAVSIAMEAPGTDGYVTRGSVVGSDLIAESTLYIGVYLTVLAAKLGSSIRQSFW